MLLVLPLSVMGLLGFLARPNQWLLLGAQKSSFTQWFEALLQGLCRSAHQLLHAAGAGSGAGKLSRMAQQTCSQSSQQPQRLPGQHVMEVKPKPNFCKAQLMSCIHADMAFEDIASLHMLHCQRQNCLTTFARCMRCRKEQACNAVLQLLLTIL